MRVSELSTTYMFDALMSSSVSIASFGESDSVVVITIDSQYLYSITIRVLRHCTAFGRVNVTRAHDVYPSQWTLEYDHKTCYWLHVLR